jgi:hypothetical protein
LIEKVPTGRPKISTHLSTSSPSSIFTTRNMEINDVFWVTFEAGVTNVLYLWRYVQFHHRTLVGPRRYLVGWHFYDDRSIYHHKLKQEIITYWLHVLWWIIYHHKLKWEFVIDWLHLRWHFSFVIVWILRNGPHCGQKNCYG